MTVADDVGVVADAQGFAHVVVGDQHTDPAGLQEPDDVLDLQHGNRVDAGKGLVQQDETRARGQGAGNLHPAPLAAGQGGRGRIAQMVHPQVLEQFIEAAADFCFGQGFAIHIVLQLQNGAHVLRHREFAEDRGLLRQVTQAQPGAPVDGQGFDAVVVQQDFATIAPHTIEEAYEVEAAIRQGDISEIRNELGDLLFQVVFQSQMFSEQGAFNFQDVVEAVSEKLIRRHPHVFQADQFNNLNQNK